MPSASSWQAVLPEDWQAGGFGLYVHWPFCQSKCPYCDFNSHVSANIDQTAWRDALVSEVERSAALLPERTLNTIFFGGGTPSLMNPDVVASIIDAARQAWAPSNNMEITLEANPTSVEAGRFRAYRDAGVTRVSMGVQALKDADLKSLGRLHSVAEAEAAFDVARSVFDRVSFDLIYARQNQTLADWQDELKRAIAMAVDHLSLYQLTIESGTAFGDRYDRGLLKGLPDEDVGADMYAATQEICGAAGLAGYETSNHSLPGAESRHNQIYWRYGDYVGIGPGAHGRITLNGQRQSTEEIRQPIPWLRSVQSNQRKGTIEVLSRTDQAIELMMMGLRLAEGISLTRFESVGGVPVDLTAINRLSDAGLIHIAGDQLSTTEAGRPLLNAILRDLLLT